jgi:hypothetical protein
MKAAGLLWAGFYILYFPLLLPFDSGYAGNEHTFGD